VAAITVDFQVGAIESGGNDGPQLFCCHVVQPRIL